MDVNEMDLDALLKTSIKNKKVSDLQKNIADQFKKYQAENKEKMAIFKKKIEGHWIGYKCDVHLRREAREATHRYRFGRDHSSWNGSLLSFSLWMTGAAVTLDAAWGKHRLC